MDQILFWLVPAASIMALCFAWYFHRQMMKESEGTPQMIKIAAAVRKGAMSYLKQQYKIVGWVFLGLVILFSIMAYGFHVQNAWVPIAFLTGGFFSGLSGFLGMKTATYASARTANAARGSLNAGLRIAFRSGAVMGLVVVGLGLLDISFWYLLLNEVIPADATSVEDLENVFKRSMEVLGGKIDFVLHSIGMSPNVRKKRTYDDLDYDMLGKTLDISAISFHKMIQAAKKLDAIAEYGSILALSYVAAQRR